MGRLVKAFSFDQESDRPTQFDERQFLREAGEIAARLRTGVLSRDSTDSSTLATSAVTKDSAAENVGQRLRVVRPDNDQMLTWDAVELALKAGDLAEAREAFQELRRDVMATIGTGGQVDRELLDEQMRWTERHAARSRELERRESDLQKREAELVSRDARLADEMRTLESRTARLAADAETHVRQRLEGEFQRLNHRIQQLEADVLTKESHCQHLTKQTAELQVALSELRQREASDEQQRAERARRMIEDCDRRIAELAGEKAAAQQEIESARRALDQARQHVERELIDRKDAAERELAQRRAAFESERDASAERLRREQSAWADQFRRESTELENSRTAAQREVARLQEQNSEWESQRTRLEAQLRHLQTAHTDALNKTRDEMNELIRQEQSRLEELRVQVRRLEAEHAGFADRKRTDLEAELMQLKTSWFEQQEAERRQLDEEQAAWQQANDRWRDQQAQEAADLRVEREKLDADRRRQELEMQRTRDEWAQREQIATEKLAQQEREFSSRQRQFEHELHVQSELHHRKLSEERAAFDELCARRTSDLSLERSELDRQRRQIEHERAMLRNGLQQMDAQLRWFAANLNDQNSPVAASDQPTDLAVRSSFGRRLDIANAAPAAPHFPEAAAATSQLNVALEFDETTSANDVNPVEWVAETDHIPALHRTDGAASVVAQHPGRRQALEEYRARLCDLQTQLQALATSRAENTATDALESPLSATGMES